MKVAELDMTTLDAMELKNFLLKLLARAKSKTQLIRIIQHVEEVVEEDDAEDAETFWGAAHDVELVVRPAHDAVRAVFAVAALDRKSVV